MQVHHFKGLECLQTPISWVAGTNLQQIAEDALFYCINMHRTLIHCVIYGHFAIHSLGREAAAKSAAKKFVYFCFDEHLYTFLLGTDLKGELPV